MRSRAAALHDDDVLTKRRPDGPWWYDFTIEGRRYRRSTGTKTRRLAGIIAGARYEEILRGNPCVRSEGRMTIGGAAERWYEEHASASAYGRQSQRYQYPRIASLLGPKTDMADLTDERVAKMLAALRAEGAGPATLNRYLATLSSICRRASEIWGVRVGSWSVRKHRQREPDAIEAFLTHGEARALVDAIVPHARAPILFDLLTGLRKANALGIQWENIRMDVGTAILRQKGDRRLSLRLTADTVALLAGIEPDPAKRTGPVFRYGNPHVGCGCPHCASPAFRGQQIRDVRRSFATAKRRVGITRRIRLHDLRHTMATWLLAATGNLRLVQAQLGHARITTTVRYAHAMEDGRAEAVEKATAALFARAEKGEPT